jgi:hypothetical protein
MMFVLFWFGFAAIVGVAANSRGRSGGGWFLLAILISPLLAGLLILALPRVGAGSEAATLALQSQMLFDAMTDEEKQRVIQARDAREAQRQAVAERQHQYYRQRAAIARYVVAGLFLMLAAWGVGKGLAEKTPAVVVEQQR